MIRRLPVAETALEAVMFGLRHVPTLLRLGWFSLLVSFGLVCLALYVMAHAFNGLPAFLAEMVAFIRESGLRDGASLAAKGRELEAIVSQVPDLAPILVGFGIFFAAAAVFVPLFVVLARVAAGEATAPSGLFYWQWGARESRTLVTMVGHGVASIVIALVLVTFATVVAAGAAASAQPALKALSGLLPLGVMALLLWITLRLLLIVPAAALDDDINFLAAIRATGGNVFRILGSLMLMGLMSLAVFVAAGIAALVLSIIGGLTVASFGTETETGRSFARSVLLTQGLLFAYVGLAAKLGALAWYAKAWRALRG
jgi:hypothetical protein